MRANAKAKLAAVVLDSGKWQKDYGINNCLPLFLRFYLFRFLFAPYTAAAKKAFFFPFFFYKTFFSVTD